MRGKHFFMMLMLVGIFMAASMVAMMMKHEESHQRIFQYFGYDSAIHYTWWGGYVDPNVTMNMSSADFRAVESLQTMNELVSYQYGILFVFVVGMFMLTMTIIDNYFSSIKKMIQNDTQLQEP